MDARPQSLAWWRQQLVVQRARSGRSRHMRSSITIRGLWKRRCSSCRLVCSAGDNACAGVRRCSNSQRRSGSSEGDSGRHKSSSAARSNAARTPSKGWAAARVASSGAVTEAARSGGAGRPGSHRDADASPGRGTRSGGAVDADGQLVGEQPERGGRALAEGKIGQFAPGGAERVAVQRVEEGGLVRFCAQPRQQTGSPAPHRGASAVPPSGRAASVGDCGCLAARCACRAACGGRDSTGPGARRRAQSHGRGGRA